MNRQENHYPILKIQAVAINKTLQELFIPPPSPLVPSLTLLLIICGAILLQKNLSLPISNALPTYSWGESAGIFRDRDDIYLTTIPRSAERPITNFHTM